MKVPFKALSFDAAGTLFELAEPVGHTYARLASEAGVNLPPAALEKGFRRAWKNYSGTLKVGIGEDRAFWRKLVAETFAIASAEQSIATVEISDHLFGTLFDHYASATAWRLFPETESVLRRYSENLPMLVISNFDRRLNHVLGELGIIDYFDAVVISDDHGFRKPHSRLFSVALEILQISPGQLLHTGDDPVCDWQGAEAAGCQAFRLDRPGASLIDLPVPQK